MTQVSLGFLEDCDPWQVQSRLFPSKFGGKPAWLSLENIPSYEELMCDTCKKTMIFLCQLYVPYEDDPNNFHRTLFVFICREKQCCKRNTASNIKVFRSSLKRENKFYSSEPPLDEDDQFFSLAKWVNLCELCGCYSTNTCSKCKKAYYCSKEHQVVDWKEGAHKSRCGTDSERKSQSKYLFPEKQIIEEEEEDHLEKRVIDETAEFEKLAQLQANIKIGTLDEEDEKLLESFVAVDEDKVFSKFKKRVEKFPDQVIRYQRGGEPLWIAKEPVPTDIPNCEYCGSLRQFEFQIMPQTLDIIKETELDWGVIAIYTCIKSCTEGTDYKKDFVFKQDVELNKL